MKKILFICGSLNQTIMMHKISQHLEKEYECYFSQFYTDGFLELLRKAGFLNFSILGGEFFRQTTDYLVKNYLLIDYQGKYNDYDLIYTCSDLIVPKNIQNKPVILVQEGMTDPENFMYYFVRILGLPRFFASTSTNGLSDMYNRFCVASEGYENFFVSKGVKREKIAVTGIPNFDDAEKYLQNNFPYKDYVLVATSDSRETFKYENRKKFIRKALKIADGKQIIFKLHPNENVTRAKAEINKYAPGSLIYFNCDINPMIANCSILFTRFSSVVYIGMALGKKIYSDFDTNKLMQLLPIQNGGISSKKIAEEGKQLLENCEIVKLRKTESFPNSKSYSKPIFIKGII